MLNSPVFAPVHKHKHALYQTAKSLISAGESAFNYLKFQPTVLLDTLTSKVGRVQAGNFLIKAPTFLVKLGANGSLNGILQENFTSVVDSTLISKLSKVGPNNDYYSIFLQGVQDLRDPRISPVSYNKTINELASIAGHPSFNPAELLSRPTHPDLAETCSNLFRSSAFTSRVAWHQEGHKLASTPNPIVPTIPPKTPLINAQLKADFNYMSKRFLASSRKLTQPIDKTPHLVI